MQRSKALIGRPVAEVLTERDGDTANLVGVSVRIEGAKKTRYRISQLIPDESGKLQAWLAWGRGSKATDVMLVSVARLILESSWPDPRDAAAKPAAGARR